MVPPEEPPTGQVLPEGGMEGEGALGNARWSSEGGKGGREACALKVLSTPATAHPPGNTLAWVPFL